MQNNIKTIIWDLDNTLYKFSDHHVLEWHTGVVDFMQKNGVGISTQDGIDLAEKGWQDHRNSNHYFTEQYGVFLTLILFSVRNIIILRTRPQAHAES